MSGMEAKPRRFPIKIFVTACWILVAGVNLLLSTSAVADGGFVVPEFVWDKHKDINEPTQKAIIAYDSGHEDLILQVKYDGPVEEFGWLVPVPSVPRVTQASMSCFYELSKFTQRKFEFEHRPMVGTLSIGGAEEKPPEVKVVEVKTVGAYQIAVLSAKDAGALENWLAQNDFWIPKDKAGVIDSYAKRGWYFVAARINLSKGVGFEINSGTPKAAAKKQNQIAEKLSNGELHPLHLSFATDKCVFPLRISSINGRASEVQVYVLSSEPLAEKGMFRQKLIAQHQWRMETLAKIEAAKDSRFNRAMSLRAPQVEPVLMNRTFVNDEELVPYTEADSKELPACAKAISLPDHKIWLTKQTWTFKPEEMRDLEFEPAISVFTAALSDEEGAFAAENLAQWGKRGTSSLLAATQSANSRPRAHALAALDRLSAQGMDSATKSELLRRLPALLKDTDPEVRLHSVRMAVNFESPQFLSQALDLLRDDNPEVANAALEYVSREHFEVSSHIPLLKQMLHDTNSTVQLAGLRLLFNNRIEIPRADLLPLLSVPRSEIAALAYQILDKDGLSIEETKALLQNSSSMIRMIGLIDIAHRTNSQAIGMMIPMMNDPDENVRVRAHNLLRMITGQTFAIDDQDHWKRWWAQNKSTFVVDQSKMEQRRLEIMRERRAAREAGLPPTSGP